MRKLILSAFGLLSALTAGADTVALQADSISLLFNNLIAQLTQQIEVSVRNTSATDYEGRLYLKAIDTGAGTLTHCLDTMVALKAGTAKALLLYTDLPEGDLELRLTIDGEGREVIGRSYVSIQPLRKLNFHARLSLDMLTEADGVPTLYGSHIRGWARVESHDASYYGARGGTAGDDGIVLWIEDSDSRERLFAKHIASKLLSGNSTETTFGYDAVFRDGARYALKVGYGMPYGLEPVDSLCFTTRPGANTYWTAQGQVLPLPVGDNRQLVVPAEAVAVDLRGQQTVDASQANPNCLYYLDQAGNLPDGLDECRNIIRGLEAKNIKLTEGHDYYCPLAFNTQFVSFLMTPSYDNADDELRGRGYSETLVLPFHPAHACLYDVNGEGNMLHADMLKVLRYYGNTKDSLNVVQLSSISQMNAYEPYILGVYIGSQLLFIGENTLVPMTRETVVRGQGVDFVGTTVARYPSMPTYQYNADDTRFYPSTADIAPFRAYMEIEGGAWPADGCLSFSDEVWGEQGKPGDTSAIDGLAVENLRFGDLPAGSEVGCDVGGRQVASRPSVGRKLPKGVYISGGRKVIVK